VSDDASKNVMRLSPSTAKILLRKSPLIAWTRHRMGGDVETEDTDSMLRGKILDRMLLGVGPEIVVVDAKDWRTNAAKETRDAAEAAGKLPVLVGKLDAYNEIVEAWRSQLAERGCRITEGRVQKRLEWESEGVPCCGKPDSVLVDGRSAIIYDLKSVEDASDDAVVRAVVNYGWDIQAAAYVEGVEATWPDLAGRVTYEIVPCESTRENAFSVNVKPMGHTMLELGARKWARAKRLWGECLRSGKWRGYSGTPIEATAWQLSDEMEREMGANDNATAPF